MTEWATLVPELLVANLARSVEFYRQILGAQVRFQRSGPAFAYLDVGQAQIMLEEDHGGAWITQSPAYPRGRGINLQIEVSSVSDIVADADRLSVPLFRPVAERWYATDGELEEGQLEVLVLDPDGYMLRAIEPLGSRERRLGYLRVLLTTGPLHHRLGYLRPQR
jgi:catechol 2,3-dioxygenase-like lactoylglutathione lyase family enzyme